MRTPTLLIHHGAYQPLWQQPGLIQVGPQIADGPESLRLMEMSVTGLQNALKRRGLPSRGVLIQYTDPFLLRTIPMHGIRQWPGPRLLACGDLHHGPDPIGTLKQYSVDEPHDAVLLTFNPALLENVQKRLPMPVRCLAPTFFRYPAATPSLRPRLELLHVGSLGPHHPRRRELVEALIKRQQVPFRHATTANADEAARLYSQYALVLNVPLNQDLNHRLYEVMAAGVPQVIFGDRSLLGNNCPLINRSDLFWTNSIEELESLVQRLFAKPNKLKSIPVEPPPYWDLKALLKAALAP
ncbi:glycosyltransferase family 1 protein [Synechococcus sp. MU1642]|uniref:glycosyltransferase family protein n=1 Tax=Synechococcus sp. MU1642 TaxID=2508348 RepID=UPI001CF8D664|nr:glycosyltransferase family 1 protein [Synechococcus sp. MU1642]MCB4408005.1 glycosyltransferase family 1 protein [Synechococcus sp. MU1642]